MKGLSVNQPSASAIAAGAKKYETRGWKPTPDVIGTRIAIHASKSKPPNRALAGLIETLAREERLHRLWLEREGYVQIPERFAYVAVPEKMPRGVILATAVVAEALPTEPLEHTITDAEWAVGDFSPRRFAWRLEDVRRLATPIPYQGALSLFEIKGDALEQLVAAG